MVEHLEIHAPVDIHVYYDVKVGDKDMDLYEMNYLDVQRYYDNIEQS